MDEWMRLASEARAARDPWTTPAVGGIYEFAQALAPAVLSRLGLPRAHVEDLVADLLATKLHLIIASDGPRAYFCSALWRRAISLKRKPSTRVVADPPLDAPGHAQITSSARGIEAKIDLPVILAFLTPRERDVVSALADGVTAKEIAAALGTKPDAVYQIVHRVRAKLEKAGLP